MRSTLRTSFLFVSVAALLALDAGCGLLSRTQENEVEKAGTTILCVLQEVELADPTLEKICESILGNLSPEQRAAIQTQIAETRKAETRRVLTPRSCDGADAGTKGGGR